VLTDDELRAVWTAAEAIGWPFGRIVQGLILTGQRRDEVGEARWGEIDLAGRLWVLPRERAKNDAAHAVPLSPAAVALLEGCPRVKGRAGFVFSLNGERPFSGWSKAKERLDTLALAELRKRAEKRGGNPEEIALPSWRLHDLRRTVASGMARLGVNLPVIEKVLNHTSGSFGGVVGVYQRHSFAEEKRAALEAWGGFVERLVVKESAGGDAPAEE
jgi:integrase